VDVQYQKAFNTVPQILQIAEQYLQNESEIQTSIAALRSGLSKAQNGSFEDKEQFVQNLNATTSIVVKAVNENYPQLRSVALYEDTIIQIVNVQNEIAMEKIRYNDRVQAYNAHRQQCCIPLFVANAFGFDAKEYIGFKDRPNQDSFPEGAQL
jgi:LemA protein